MKRALRASVCRSALLLCGSLRYVTKSRPGGAKSYANGAES